ncbi:MAG: hypothetical protein AAF661_04980 [Pseudomonadota bacterium]
MTEDAGSTGADQGQTTTTPATTDGQQTTTQSNDQGATGAVDQDVSATTAKGDDQAGDGATSLADLAGDADKTDASDKKDAAADGEKEGGQDKDAKADGAEENPLIGAPEKYDITMPEGWNFDQAKLDKFEDVFRKMNLSNEGVSQLVALEKEIVTDTISRITSEANAAADQRQKKREDAMIERLGEAGYDTKDFNDNPKHQARRDAVAGMIGLVTDKGVENPRQLAGDILSQLDAAGATPVVLPLLAKVGRAVQGDGFVIGGKAVETATDPRVKAAKTLYPNQAKRNPA